MNIFLWAILPYMVLVALVGGLVWRWRHDQFGWTSRSSQLYESTLMRWGGPIFHYGIIFVFLGHLLGLLIPKTWTDTFMSNATYHAMSQAMGIPAGILAFVGVVIFIVRRAGNPRVARTTSTRDVVVFVALFLVVLFGMIATLFGGRGAGGQEVLYRETVSLWFRSLFIFRPDIAAMSAATWQFKVHVVIGLLFFALIPYTRLVHFLSIPLHYIVRPFIVYRSRGKVVAPSNSHSRMRGWVPVGTLDNEQGES